MEQGALVGKQRSNEQDFDLREWRIRARISRENTSSRRYSASYIRSFREDSSRSFRSNFTISSTASSPGYHFKDEIDPSTYPFTTALKALQARSGYVWECLSPEGFALNSKWNEAERYISNPFSGEVPMECLSAKTLNGSSFRSYMASRVTMSAPLVYSHVQPRTRTRTTSFSNQPQLLIQGKHTGCKTRDVGIQSSPPLPDEGSSSSPSAASTPSIRERSINHCEDTEEQDEDVQNSNSSVKSKAVEEAEWNVTREGEETRGRSKVKESSQTKKKKRKTGQECNCRNFTGCSFSFSWRRLWRKTYKAPQNKQIDAVFKNGGTHVEHNKIP